MNEVTGIARTKMTLSNRAEAINYMEKFNGLYRMEIIIVRRTGLYKKNTASYSS